MNKHLFLILLLFEVACSKTTLLDSQPAQIRVKNVSAFHFDEVTIWMKELGAIERGLTSEYFTMTPAYDKASIYVKIDTFQFGLTVTDYVGEQALPGGKYTFEVNISELAHQGYLTQNFIRDRD